MTLLDLPVFKLTRRNHAIEHATVHILSAQYPKTPLAGRSDHKGFYLYGDVPTYAVQQASEEAVRRLMDEPELAVHPLCGTNLVVGGIMAGLAAVGVMATLPERRKASAFEALPRFMLASTFASLVAQQLGPLAQAHVTTFADTTGAKIGTISRRGNNRFVTHRVDVENVAA